LADDFLLGFSVLVGLLFLSFLVFFLALQLRDNWFQFQVFGNIESVFPIDGPVSIMLPGWEHVIVVDIFEEWLDFGSPFKSLFADSPGHSSWRPQDPSHQSMSEFSVLPQKKPKKRAKMG
jgi:hypothetical protein